MATAGGGRSSSSPGSGDSVAMAHPRVMLTTQGITTPELVGTFSQLLHEAAAGELPVIALVITAALAPCSLHPCVDGESTSAVAREAPSAAESMAALKDAKGLIDAKALSEQVGARMVMVDAAHDSLDEMRSALHRSHCVYVLGGNTFWLQYHMQRSGLNELIRQRVLEHGVLYVGCSAGSIVAGQSITPAFWKGWDNPNVVSNWDWSQPHTTKGACAGD